MLPHRDFAERFGIQDMYSGGFYPYPDVETRWAFWARNIYVNRYMNPPKPIYQDLYELVKDKDYFVITTNVDHCLWECAKICRLYFRIWTDYV